MSCYNCSNRRVGCHTNCSDYAAYKAERAEKQKTAYRNKEKEDALWCYAIKAVQRRVRKKS